MLVTAGISDPRVTYWEPAKYVARLRATGPTTNPLLLKTNMASGHFGQSGRSTRCATWPSSTRSSLLAWASRSRTREFGLDDDLDRVAHSDRRPR